MLLLRNLNYELNCEFNSVGKRGRKIKKYLHTIKGHYSDNLLQLERMITEVLHFVLPQ